MATYSLEIQAIGLYLINSPVLEIWEDGVLHSSTSISLLGTTINTSISYAGSMPSSLELRFNDGSGELGRLINIIDVKINDKHINVGNFLSLNVLTNGVSTVVDVSGSGFIYDSTEPLASVFSSPTVAMDNLNNTFRNFNGTVDQVIDAQGGRDVIYLGAGADKVSGGAGDDILKAGDGNDLLFGGIGDDRLYGEEGDDLMYGGDGDDRLYGNEGADEMHGGDGADNLNGHDGDDIITGGIGNDKLNGGAGDDYLFGEEGDDQLIGDIGNDTIDGGAGDDIAYGGAGDDIINGGADNDILVGDIGNDTIHGDGGNDTIYGSDGDDVAYGDDGNDLIYGDEGNDTLHGGDGVDVIAGGYGADTIDGGTGNDFLHGHGLTSREIFLILKANPGVSFNTDTNSFYQFVNSGSSYAVATAAAQASTLGGIAGHLVNITSATENAYIDSLINVNVWMSATDSEVEGQWVWNGGAEDGLNFWNGAAGGSAPGYTYENWANAEPNDYGAGEDTSEFRNGSGEWNDNDGNLPYVIEWDAGMMSDDNAVDTISGGSGNDWIYGYGGDDVLYGDAGNDVLIGGEGNDTLDGGANNDVLHGGSGNDILNGGANDDVLYGGVGDDTLDGGSGNDILFASKTGTSVGGVTVADILSANPSVSYNAATGNFYQYVDAGSNSMNFSSAVSASASNTINGVASHLVTLTSAAEQTFVGGLVSGGDWAWINGTDSAVEGTFRWTAGPESGTAFNNGVLTWSGGSLGSTNSGSADNVLIYDGGGDVLYAYAGTNTAYGYVAEWEGSALLSAGTFSGYDSAGEINIVNGGAGNDTIYGSMGNDTLNGDAGTDTIYSGSAETLDAAIANVLSNNSGVSYSADTNSFYQVVTSTTSWTAANAAANSSTLTGMSGVNGHLVTITSATEQTYVQGLAGGSNTWLGGSDSGSEGVWRWTSGPEAGAQFANSTGTAVNGWYNNWLSGQPNDSNGTQDYLYMNAGRWADLVVAGDGSTGFVTVTKYIIEWEANSLLSGVDVTTINGGTGTDALYGSTGIDAFIFDNTSNTDTVYNFDTAGHDYLDISSIISYNSASGDLTEFVRLTESGGNTTVAVDANGGGNSFVNIAVLDGVTGLDLDLMVAADNLVVQ